MGTNVRPLVSSASPKASFRYWTGSLYSTGSNAVIGGASPSNRSTCTSTVCADGDCASLLVPLSRVSTLGFPCLSKLLG